MPTSPPAWRQAILVLGMHRSGTSALSGVLAQLGVQPPKTLMEPARDNARGFWESKEIVAFHERLLDSVGSVWSDWSEIDDATLGSEKVAEHLVQLPALIEQEFGDASLFFVKDPRMCRFPGVWVRALVQQGIQTKAIIPIRHPTEVACSLESRNHLGMTRSRLIWLRHVLDAEHATRGIRRAIVPYARLFASWRAEVERVAAELDLEWPVPVTDAESQIEAFLDARLRHFSEEVEHDGVNQLGHWVNDVYALLQQLGGKDDQGALQRLDQIRREFNLASAIFAPAFRKAELAHAEAMAALRKRLDAKPATPETSTADIVAAVERKLAEVESRIKVEQRAEMAKLAVSVTAELSAYRSSTATLAESMLAEQSAHRSDTAKLAESMRVAAERHGAALDALSDELRSRSQWADDLRSKLRAQSDEFAVLRRRFDQSNELYRQESGKRKAINAELERIVAEQCAALDSSARKIHADQGEIIGLRRELHRLRALHASGTAEFQREIARQQHLAESATDELNLLRNSKAFKVSSLLRRALGRQMRISQDELIADIETIKSSGLFDPHWYLDHYPDVAGEGIDPVAHYLRFGAAELRNPNVEFDTRGYLDRYPDVRAAGFNPLLHYIQFGMREGRSCGTDKSS